VYRGLRCSTGASTGGGSCTIVVPSAGRSRCDDHPLHGRGMGNCRYTGPPIKIPLPPAGKTQVVKRGLAALCSGDDVVYHHGLAAIGFGCLTISAPVVVYFDQLLAQFGRQVCAHYRAPPGLPDMRPVRLPNWAERRPGWHGAPLHHTIDELPGQGVADVNRRALVIAELQRVSS
jgi:hypothetical protein